MFEQKNKDDIVPQQSKKPSSKSILGLKVPFETEIPENMDGDFFDEI